MSQGTIKSLDSEQGIGYIKTDQQPVSFQRSNVQDVVFEELQVGQIVEYDIETGAQSQIATLVRPVAQPVA
jgi:cold shock CspA family protein